MAGAALSVRGPLAKPSGGVWSGLSSLVRMGLGVPQPTSVPRALVPGLGGKGGRTRTVYLLTEGTLQKWNLWAHGPGAFVWEMPLRESVQRVLVEEALAMGGGDGIPDPAGLNVWLCDMQMAKGGLVVLAASTLAVPSPDEIPMVAYTLFLVDDEAPAVTPLTTLNASPDYEPDNEYVLLEEIKVEVPRGGPLVYVFTPSGIEAVWLGADLAVGEARRLPLQSLRLVGAASVGAMAVVFPAYPESNLITLSPAGGRSDAAVPVVEMTVGDLDAVESKRELLTQAFSAYYYGRDSSVHAPITASADARACVLVSATLVDERAASDVRWAEGDRSLEDRDTVIVVRQLEEKMRRNAAFVEFIGHAQKLSIEARWELMQHMEKLAAALALRRLHNDADERVSRLLSHAMKRVVAARGSVDEHGVMGPVDLFFSDVSRVDEILPAIADELANADPDAVLRLAEAVAVVLQTARDFRLKRHAFFSLPEWMATAASCNDQSLPESWSSTGPVQAVVEAMIQAAGTEWSLLASLSDALLCGLRHEALREAVEAAHAPDSDYVGASQRAARLYDDTREERIHPFIASGHMDLARDLAVEHRHYEALVELCFAGQDGKLLEEYAQRFSDDGFHTRMFQWLLSRGRRADLLAQPASRWSQLAEFLAPHPTLAWVHALACEDYPKAAAVLHGLATSDPRLLARKKTLLSLSKLCVLAADGVPAAESAAMLHLLDNELYVVRAQEILAPGRSDALQLPELIALCVSGRSEDARDRYVLAHEIVTKSAAADRTHHVDVWRHTIQADDWAGLAARKARGEADDDEVLAFVRGSMAFWVLVKSPPDAAAEAISDALGPDDGARGLLHSAIQLAAEE